eukprot:scaffold7835_cov122-Isochrysis_galbana.AAC.2
MCACCACRTIGIKRDTEVPSSCCAPYARLVTAATAHRSSSSVGASPASPSSPHRLARARAPMSGEASTRARRARVSSISLTHSSSCSSSFSHRTVGPPSRLKSAGDGKRRRYAAYGDASPRRIS